MKNTKEFGILLPLFVAILSRNFTREFQLFLCGRIFSILLLPICPLLLSLWFAANTFAHSEFFLVGESDYRDYCDYCVHPWNSWSTKSPLNFATKYSENIYTSVSLSTLSIAILIRWYLFNYSPDACTFYAGKTIWNFQIIRRKSNIIKWQFFGSFTYENRNRITWNETDINGRHLSQVLIIRRYFVDFRRHNVKLIPIEIDNISAIWQIIAGNHRNL